MPSEASRDFSPVPPAVLLLASVLASGGLASASPGDFVPGKTWVRASSPEALGWRSAGLAAARAYSNQIGSAAVMIIQDGVVVDEWGNVAEPQRMRSIRKSLLGGLYGMAVAEGKIDPRSTLGELGIDEKSPLTQDENRATVRDLLTSRSGVYLEAAYETRDGQEDRPRRGSHPPGSFFYYNNWDFNALGTIYERKTGEKIFDAFRRRIAEPLQMQDFSLDLNEYRVADASQHAAYLFRLSARDLARFGLLYLRRGRWQDRQILTPEWITESTEAHVAEAEGPLGYAYLWWAGPRLENGKQDGFYALGNGGQFLFVCPERRLVIVHVADTDWMLLKRLLGQVPTGEERWRLRKLILAAAPEAR